jgi:phosphatidylinositol dimannoside acyltransferase
MKGRASLRDRLVAGVLWRLMLAVQRLPSGTLHRLAHTVGALLYLARPARRELVRANLARICAWLVARGEASPRIEEAARERGAMDRLVRDAFGHYIRSYAEAAVVPAFGADEIAARVRIETPDVVARALRAAEPGGRGRLILGLHFGAVELGALYAVLHGRLPVSGPMETLGDPALQEVILRARRGTGVRILPLGSAGAELTAALARGEIVALVADRTIRGAGVPVDLFGATARLPAGPAVLALESGAETFAVAIRRVGWGRYAARMEAIELPEGGDRRSRIRRFVHIQARAFERLVSAAPEQWWTAFFPVWDDTAVGAAPDARAGGWRTARPSPATPAETPEAA